MTDRRRRPVRKTDAQPWDGTTERRRTPVEPVTRPNADGSATRGWFISLGGLQMAGVVVAIGVAVARPVALFSDTTHAQQELSSKLTELAEVTRDLVRQVQSMKEQQVVNTTDLATFKPLAADVDRLKEQMSSMVQAKANADAKHAEYDSHLQQIDAALRHR